MLLSMSYGFASFLNQDHIIAIDPRLTQHFSSALLMSVPSLSFYHRSSQRNNIALLSCPLWEERIQPNFVRNSHFR